MTSPPLFQIAYISCRAEDVTDDDVVDGIVLPAMTKNRRLDITGCLWFSPDKFIQVLEGEEETVRDLYNEIAADTRHREIDCLVAEPIERRKFERFSMRAIGADAPASVRDLILRASSTPEPKPETGGWQETMAEFEHLVRQVIADLASLPFNPREGGGGSQPAV